MNETLVFCNHLSGFATGGGLLQIAGAEIPVRAAKRVMLQCTMIGQDHRLVNRFDDCIDAVKVGELARTSLRLPGVK